ncbi:MAG: HzsA-related protein, partial [Pirellulaceae bacterium]
NARQQRGDNARQPRGDNARQPRGDNARQPRGDNARQPQAWAAAERLQQAYAMPSGQRAATDLTSWRTWWLAVRRAARDVVLTGPDLDTSDIVYFQVPLRTEGNHPDCLVQNHDRPKERSPGGDIVVQSGLGPADPTRPLLAGQLGPGHVQDMDLWWDADRIIFAYVRQPFWGTGSYRWGSVAWRNGANVTVFKHVVGCQDGAFWENGSEPTHLFEIRLDATGLRQLTDDPYYCDREPAYLPNGDVVFSSDRGCGASQCGAAPLAYSDFGLPNLFRVSADGQRVTRLTYNKDVDRYPHCLNNGLIGYMRWDYQERFWQWPHALWTIRPDGTMNDGLYKVHFNDPQSVREPRSIPDSHELVVIACGHHSPPEGAVAIVDPSQGVNNPQGLRYVTPMCSPLEGGLGSSPTVPEGGVPDHGGLYRTPWPLSDKSFLVAYSYDDPGRKNYAAYYIDVWGNKELIHRDPLLDVLCPMPVRQRPRPPELPSQVDSAASYATCFLDDVNRDMPGVPPGTVRYIRIAEQLQWYFGKQDNTGPIRWTPGTQHSRNFGYWTWSPTRVIGTVPVEADGSAYFRVPTGLAVYFQALDENLLEVRRMRSHVEFRPGEFRSCVGCHETKQHVPPSGSVGHKLALDREPSRPQPPPWGDVDVLDYERMVQPIFDRHCVRCHDATDPQIALDLTNVRDSSGFVQSYRSLCGLPKGVPAPLGEGFREANPDMPSLEKAESDLYESVKSGLYTPGGLLCLSNHMSGPEVTQPRQFGSHQSRLIRTLLDDETHRREVAMTRDEWETLVTWVDANAPYFSTFYQYFDASGRELPRAIPVRVELDPPFQAGEKTFRLAR